MCLRSERRRPAVPGAGATLALASLTHVLGSLLLSGPVLAQDRPESEELRPVAATMVAVADDEAVVRLEFVDGGRVELGLRDGRIFVDDDVLGAYEEGSDLEVAWREFVGDAAVLGGDDLARHIVSWAPAGHGEGAAALAEAIRRRLGWSSTASAVAVSSTFDVGPDVAPDVESVRSLRDEIRDEIRSEVRAELQREARTARREGRGILNRVFAPVRRVGRAVGDVVSAVVCVLALGTIGSLFVFFGRENLEVVAETARRTPARAASVGLAGTFLLLPVWVLGIVALAISLVGIVAIPFWVVLFPFAAALAGGLGYFAVARNLGEWIAVHRIPYLEWVRTSNPYTLIFGGVIALVAAFVMADLLNIFGSLLNVFEGLLVAVGVALSVGASLIGFGAVLLTRAGRRPEYYRSTYGHDGA